MINAVASKKNEPFLDSEETRYGAVQIAEVAANERRYIAHRLMLRRDARHFRKGRQIRSDRRHAVKKMLKQLWLSADIHPQDDDMPSGSEKSSSGIS